MEHSETYEENDVLKCLQQVELEMLSELNSICRRNNISYVVSGGTLLGAVRCGGFIPWDDDVDVKMLRHEYERFCRICENELDKNKYFLQTYKTDKGYLWGYARILRKGTVFMRKDQDRLKMKRGIFIDVFPVDYMPEKYVSKKLFNFIALLSRKLLYSRVGFWNEKNLLKKFGYLFLKIIPKSFAHKGFEFLTWLYKNKKSNLTRCLSWGCKEETDGYLLEWFENRADIGFENLTVIAPLKTNDYLTHAFGSDYMTPPPIDERIPKHTATKIEFSE